MAITDTPNPSSEAPTYRPPAPPAPSAHTRRAPRIIATAIIVIGVLTLVAGAALGFATTQQDRAGYFHTDTGRVQSAGFAIASDQHELDVANGDVPRAVNNAITFRIRATSVNAAKPLFIGVARVADVDAYLASVRHDVVTSLDDSPLTVDYRAVEGTTVPSRPDAQPFWLASASGTGTQELRWHPYDGDWTVVVMNADGSRAVAAQADFGVRVGWLAPIAFGLAVAGFVFVVAGAVIWLTLGRSRPQRAANDEFVPTAAS